MKRIAALVVLTAAASLVSLAPAQAAPSVCFTYDISINGQGQAGTQCVPGCSSAGSSAADPGCIGR